MDQNNTSYVFSKISPVYADKGHYSAPESETLIVSLAFEADTGYLRVVHEPAEAVKPETFHSFYLTFSPPGRVAMKAFYYKVNVTDKSIVLFQEKYLRGNFTALTTENSGRTAKPDWCHFENEIHVLVFSRFFFYNKNPSLLCMPFRNKLIWLDSRILLNTLTFS